MDRRKRLWTWLSGYRRAVHLETCTHGSEGGGGDGAVKQPRRPPTLPAVWTQEPDSSSARRDAYGASVDPTNVASLRTSEGWHLGEVADGAPG